MSATTTRPRSNSFQARAGVTREDLLFIRRHAALRVGQLSVADFIGAFHVGQRVLWDATLALAHDDAVSPAVLGLVTYIVRYFDIATTTPPRCTSKPSNC